jgi:hypothetical protein
MPGFIGGPHDGKSYDHDYSRAVATATHTSSDSGGGLFLLMPAPAACERIRKGELKKTDALSGACPYERVFMTGGEIEFHEATTNSVFDRAVADNKAPS